MRKYTRLEHLRAVMSANARAPECISLNVLCARARAMPPSLVWELGSKKASSTRELVLQHCVHNKRCNVLRYSCCGYGVSSPCRTGRGGRNIVLRKPCKGRSKRQIYRKGYWAVAGLHTSAAGQEMGSKRFFDFVTRGRDPASCHGGLLKHRGPTQLEVRI